MVLWKSEAPSNAGTFPPYFFPLHVFPVLPNRINSYVFSIREQIRARVQEESVAQKAGTHFHFFFPLPNFALFPIQHELVQL